VKKRWFDIGYQLDRLLISSFLPPFFMSFFIALFVLIMQFLWKFIDDIIGKGVGALVIIELFFYKSVSLFPLALPIAVLLAAVMVMGNLGEQYELSSFKSAGIPLTRILLPLIGISTLIGLFSFYCSNTIIPLANLKYQSRLYDIRNQKPTLSIEPGVFNEDFRGYSIRVGSKHNDKQTIEDIMVYDDSQRSKGKLSVVTAKKGKMYVSKEDGAFVMTLYDGYQYAETEEGDKPGQSPFMISHFKEWTRRFDLSEFNMEKTEEEQFKSHYSMKSARQIAIEIDTLDEQIRIAKESNQIPNALMQDSIENNEASLNRGPDSNRLQIADIKLKGKRIYQGNPIISSRYKEIKAFLDTTSAMAGNYFSSQVPISLLRNYKSQINNRISIVQSTLDRNDRTIERLETLRRKHLYELHWKFSLSVACVVMLMIGGPMGSIVRKGGFGYPLLIAIFFFTFFIMSNISCKKLNDSGKLPAVLAAWTPVMILAVISLFLTYKALRDSRFMDWEKFNAFFRRILKRQKWKTA
jgi:lipopolysaccharide export system permease protein